MDMRSGYIVRQEADSGMVVLTKDEWPNEIAFGGIPAIQAYAAENPEVPKLVVNEMIARDGGFELAVKDRAGWRIFSSNGVHRVAADAEDDAWEKAAQDAIRRHQEERTEEMERSIARQQAVKASPASAASSPGEGGLPEFCLVFIPEGGPGKYVGAVRRGEMGYSPTTYDVPDPEKAQELVAHVNRRLGVTDLQAQCMHNGSMFGWDVPGADPKHMAKVLAEKNPARELPFMTAVAGHVLIHEPVNGTPLPDDWTGLCVDANDVHSFWYIGCDGGERSFTKLKAREFAEAEIEAAELFKAEHGDYENNFRIKKGREILDANGFQVGSSVDWSKQLEGWQTVTVYSPKLDTQHGEWEVEVQGQGAVSIKREVIVDDRRLPIDHFMDKVLAAYPGMAKRSDAVVFAEANWRPADHEQARSRVASRQKSALDALSPAQRTALLDFREKHGRNWKSVLHAGWLKAAYPGALQQIRNQFGPSWLEKLTPADFEFAKGSKLCYGVLKDCSPESLSFLSSFDGVVVGQADAENGRLRHVKLTADALERVREFPADFVFEVLVEADAREPGASPSAMNADALVAEAAYLGWTLHVPESEAVSSADREAAQQRRTDVVAEVLKRAKETSTPMPKRTFEVDTPTL